MSILCISVCNKSNEFNAYLNEYENNSNNEEAVILSSLFFTTYGFGIESIILATENNAKIIADYILITLLHKQYIKNYYYKINNDILNNLINNLNILIENLDDRIKIQKNINDIIQKYDCKKYEILITFS